MLRDGNYPEGRPDIPVVFPDLSQFSEIGTNNEGVKWGGHFACVEIGLKLKLKWKWANDFDAINSVAWIIYHNYGNRSTVGKI